LKCLAYALVFKRYNIQNQISKILASLVIVTALAIVYEIAKNELLGYKPGRWWKVKQQN